jgi:tyrocidine synthetase-3
LDPAASLYNMVKAWHIHGSIDPTRFERAFWEAVGEIDALHLRFLETADSVEQAAGDAAGHFEHLDFSVREDPGAAFDAWAASAARVTFRIDQSLWHAALAKLADDHYVWYLNQHHLITDITSCGLLFNAVSELYESQSESGEKLRGQFLDYVKESESARAVEPGATRLAAALAFWEPRLTPMAKLAPYGRTPGPRTAASSRTEVGADTELEELLEAGPFTGMGFSKDSATVAVLAAALMCLLFRITGQARQRVGLLMNGRTTGRLRSTVGMIVETVPVELEFDASTTFRFAVEQIVRQLQLGFRHLHYGISQGVRADALHVMLNYLPIQFPAFAGLPVTTDWVYPGQADPGHALRLQVHDFSATGSRRFVFDTNDAAFGARERGWLIGQFDRLLREVLRGPDTLVVDVDLLTDQDRRSLVVDFNERPAVLSAEVLATVLQPSPARVSEIAIRHADRELGYAELHGLADAIALRLTAEDVSVGDRLAVCMPPSIEAVAAILAVLKVGAAFVPLDPAHPDERLARVVAEVGEGARPIVLAIDEAAARMRELGFTVIEVDASERAASAFAPVTRPPDALCYVLYTSGSTGEPKGVMVEDRALANYVGWAARTYLDDRPGNLPLFTSLAFDLTLTSLFLPLLTGGTIHVYHDPKSTGMTELQAILHDDLVDAIKLTPSHLALLEPDDFHSKRLKAVVLGGETLSAELARRAHAAWGGRVELYNEYGPTEATVGCMIHKFDPSATGSVVPIGVPIDGAKIYVLDERGRPLPRGIVGELCVGGRGVSRGYLHREALTHAKFVEIVEHPHGKVYRTGDAARWTASGQVEFLGRTDRQVKVHGARVELDEISSVLARHPKIKSATAMTRVDDGRPSLVAFYVASDAIPGTQLRDFARRWLPVYMLPNRFQRLDEMPLTPNAKVDFAALQALTVDRAGDATAPRDAEESLVLSAWESSLETSGLGVYDDFFELGGDSLAAIRIAACLEEHGWHLHPGDLFEHSTVAAAARCLTRVDSSSETGEANEPFSLMEGSGADMDRLRARLGTASDAQRAG